MEGKGETNGGVVGAGSNGGGGTGSAGNSTSGIPYWQKHRKRRTMSAQLVFPTGVPENTEEIVQPDPNLSGKLWRYVYSICWDVFFFFFSQPWSQELGRYVSPGVAVFVKSMQPCRLCAVARNPRSYVCFLFLFWGAGRVCRAPSCIGSCRDV